MGRLEEFLKEVSNILWGSLNSLFHLDVDLIGDMPILAMLLLFTGIFLTVKLRFMPILHIPKAFVMLWKGRKVKKGEDGHITPFAALATALSSSIGTGNIVGVATAISLGGPGAIFWMWMTALVGMATKYTECMLAVKYRVVDSSGNYKGGPMYYIENGLGKNWKWLAIVFTFGALITAIGSGNLIQSNSIAEVAQLTFKAPTAVTGLVLTFLTFIIIIGGIETIGKFTSKLVPVMALGYFVMALVVLLMNYSEIPKAFSLIFNDAFNGHAAAGGFAGAMIAEAIRYGIARGLFSNEAGQGSAPIVHAVAKTTDPVKQGTIAMLGTFIDTILICTITALVILTVKGDFIAVNQEGIEVSVNFAWQSTFKGAGITAAAFDAGIPGGDFFITITLIVFAFSTILGWTYYGERALAYLIGEKYVISFRYIWCGLTFLGSISSVQAVWTIGEISNAIMTAPNLVAILLLSQMPGLIKRG